MRKIRLFILLLLLSLSTLLGFSHVSAYLSENRPIVACEEWGFYPPEPEKYYAHPEKLVVQPWRGPHNVYALFTIPGGHSSDAFFTVSIPGDRTYCGNFQSKEFVSSGLERPRYNLVVKGFLNTRIALKLILKGKFSQLREADNWSLGYVQRYIWK